jgi:hypothetical protein
MLTHKTLMREFSNDRLKVYKVDTKFIQNDKMPCFIGGHALIMPFIPAGEMWIADDLSEHDCKSTVYYLLVQKDLMAGGINYQDSIKRASKLETENQDRLDDSIKEELEKIDKLGRIVEPNYANGKHRLLHGKSEKHHQHLQNLIENQRKRRNNLGKKKHKFNGDALMRALT